MRIFIGKYPSARSNKERKVNIRIDDYDVWNMDETLAMIIVPMLKRLKEIKHGGPHVDDDDVPEGMNLRSYEAPEPEEEYDVDANFFKRWDWVMDEMIWTFEQLREGGNFCQFYDHSQVDESLSINEQIAQIKRDDEGMEKHDKRIKNGLRLFAKYYRSLWD